MGTPRVLLQTCRRLQLISFEVIEKNHIRLVWRFTDGFR
ncbi:hypothetical protein LEP1GSC040_3454 [Leptospira santarosai str. 2000030832]|nr:hypothetical protein LEP1GSC040_3454 [Leptospira santarosai str. 2000030832]